MNANIGYVRAVKIAVDSYSGGDFWRFHLDCLCDSENRPAPRYITERTFSSYSAFRDDSRMRDCMVADRKLRRPRQAGV